MIEYSLIRMYCGVPESELSQTDDVAHHGLHWFGTLGVQ